VRVIYTFHRGHIPSLRNAMAKLAITHKGRKGNATTRKHKWINK
jgi:hypothetical protein